MKKILVLLGVAAISQASTLAYMYENETSSMRVMGAQGYSTATMQVVDLINYRNRGANGKYVRHFQKRQHGRGLGKAYQELKEYVDPAQDDGLFGEHSIQFTNTWKGNDTHYSSEQEMNEQVENL